MVGILVFEPFRQLRHHRLRVWPFGQFGVVPLQCFYKTLWHAVALRACHRCGHRLEPQLRSKVPSLGCRIAAAVIGKPFTRLRRLAGGDEPILHCLLHHFAHEGCIDALSGGHPAHDLPVAAVQPKRHPYLLAVVA